MVPVFSKEHLRQATGHNRTDQGRETDQVPPISRKRYEAETIQQTNKRHQQEEGTAKVAVHAPASKRVRYARYAHCAQRDGPNDCPLVAIAHGSPGHDNRNGGKPEYEKGDPWA